MTDQGEPATGLGRHAVIGVATQVASRGARALVGVGTVAILSRFLTPAEFGLFALIFFLVTLAQFLGDFGIRAALVVRRDPSPLELHSLFWAAVAMGAVLTILTIAAAEPIARWFGDPRLADAMRVSGWVFLLSGARGLPMALLEKDFKFKALALSEVVAALIGAAVAVALAVAGKGVLALVAQQLVMAAVPAWMNFRASGYRPKAQFSARAIAPLLGYGGRVMLANMTAFLATQIDRPIVGARLSTADLGFLSVSQQIVATPIRTVVSNVTRVTFPLLASIRDDNGRILAGQLRTLHAMMLILAPICCGLSAVSAPAVELLLGPGWAPAGEIIGISAISTLLYSIAESHSSIFAAKGRADYMLRWSVFSLAANAGLLLAAVPYGLIAVVSARLFFVVIAVFLYSHFTAKLLECRLRDLFAGWWRPILAAGLMAVLVAGLDRFALRDVAAVWLRLGLLMAAGVGLYAMLLLAVDRDSVRGLLKQLNKMRRRPA
jgi:PST family polysaccharide transporter